VYVRGGRRGEGEGGVWKNWGRGMLTTGEWCNSGRKMLHHV